MKRAVIVHGWEGAPEYGWFPWLKRELEQRGFQVIVPQLPETEHPRIRRWVPALTSAVGTVDADTYFVGHSMGCQAIARCLEGLPEGQKAGGAVFVAGFFKRLTGLGDSLDEAEMVKDWLGTPLDFEKVKSHLSKSIAFFSDDDAYVPLDNQDDFRDELGSEVIVKHGMSHFNQGSGYFELPLALEAVLKLAQN